MSLTYKFYTSNLSDKQFDYLKKIATLCPFKTKLVHIDQLELMSFKSIDRKDSYFVLNIDQYYELTKIPDHLFEYPIIFFITDNLRENEWINKIKTKFPYNPILSDNVGLIELSQAIFDLINREESTGNRDDKNEKIKLHTQLLSSFKYIPCDLFGRDERDQYYKIAQKNSATTEDLLTDLEKKGQDSIYINITDFYLYFDELILAPSTDSKDELESENAIFSSNHKVIREITASLGVSDIIAQTADKTLTQIVTTLKDKTLRQILKSHRSSKISFLFDHSYLTSLFCTVIAESSSWNDPRIIKNLCMAALFHDIGLNNPLLALLENDDLKKFENISEQDRKIILNHPQRAVKKLKTLKNIPEEVIYIIENHHQGNNTTSYPQKINPKTLRPPAAAFNVSHEFAIGLYRIGMNLEKVPYILRRLDKNFNDPVFKKPLDILSKKINE